MNELIKDNRKKEEKELIKKTIYLLFKKRKTNQMKVIVKISRIEWDKI